MPRYKLVIADAALARQKEIERHTNARVARDIKAKRDNGEKVNEFDVTNIARGHRRHFEQQYKERPVGAVYGVYETECPDGLPNCRNCGDRQHAAACKAAGHCPSCGRSASVPELDPPPAGCGGHGLAPDSFLAASGYTRIAMTSEEEAAEAAAAAQSEEARLAAEEDAILARADAIRSARRR